MEEALALAAEAAVCGEVPVGCVIVCDGKIVGRGRNRREEEQNALLHAEIIAIEEACRTLGSWRLNECDLYVTLEPCPMCAGAILNARVGRVFYGAGDTNMGACGGVINL
ncbi:MAG: nucleoside deaminase, partial [Clostridia bacterium]|nr:nucleoside deaminase [Clostridia bacterium]